MTPCPTRERGHNGDAMCDLSGWPVVRGQECFRCRNVRLETASAGAEAQKGEALLTGPPQARMGGV